MKHKLRIMFSSNAHWSKSGYGQQMAEILPLIRDEGYPLALIAFYGLEGNIIEYEGIKVYPKLNHPWGSDVLYPHSKDFKADIVITFQDIWVLDPNHLKLVKRWVPLLPIDHIPTPNAIVQRLKMAYRIITYSKFGYEELKKEGLHSTYIPHTVNTDIMKPKPKTEIRKKIGIPQDIFLFGMVAANKDNPPRKSFQEVMDAYMIFRKNHKKTGLYFHTLLQQKGGFPIDKYAKFLGIEKEVYHLQPYEQLFKVKKEDMADIYSMMDCLLSPSQNEGFGVPIIEAQSCSTPVIATDFSSMSELIIDGKTGYKVKSDKMRFTPLMAYVSVPDTKEIYEKMEMVYRSNRELMGKRGRRHIIKNYDTKKVFKKYWKPYFQKVENEIYLKT